MTQIITLPLRHYSNESSDGSVYSKRIWPPTGAVYAGQQATSTLPYYFSEGKAVYCNKTERFRPGVFSVNPFDLREANTIGVPDSVWLAERFGVPYVDQVYVTGHIASLIRGATVHTLPSQCVQNDLDAWPVLTSAAAKVAQAEADVGLMLAEATETLSYLISPMKGAVKLWRKFLQGGPATVKLRMKYLTQKWLEYRYALLPLVSDVCAIIDTYENRFTNRNPCLRHTGHFEWVNNSSSVTNETTYTGHFGNWYVKHQRSTVNKYSVSAKVYFTNHLYERRLGLDVGSLPGVLWELTPWSFVGDWFINVGDWLAAVKPKPGITLLGNCVCYSRHVEETTFCNRISSYSDFRVWKPCYSTHTITTRQVLRVINEPLPPYPVVNLSFLNFMRVLDSISLIWQMLPTKKR